MERDGRVLVLGDDNRSGLTVVRSLGRRGLEVWLGTEAPDSVVPRSRYVARTMPFPPTNSRVDDWRLEELLTREPFELVIPCSDNGTARTVFISDPWSKPATEFRRCYREVAAAVDGLVDALRS